MNSEVDGICKSFSCFFKFIYSMCTYALNLLGGVHWLTLGKLTDRHGEVDGAKLLSKLQALILRLDKSNSNQQLPSLETAKNYLQKVCLSTSSLSPSSILPYSFFLPLLTVIFNLHVSFSLCSRNDSLERNLELFIQLFLVRLHQYDITHTTSL